MLLTQIDAKWLVVCRDFVGSWVKIGLPAKESTLSQVGDKPLTEQCSFCEQVITLKLVFVRVCKCFYFQIINNEKVTWM